MKKLRVYVLCFVSISLLSACPSIELDPTITVSTQSQPRVDTGGYVYNVVSVCQGDTLFVSWDLGASASGTLNASPASSVEPALNKKRIEQTGSLNVSFQAATTLEVGVRQGPYSSFSFWDVGAVPAEVCQDLPKDFQGVYEGAFEQIEPTQKTFSQPLELEWTYQGVVAYLGESRETGIELICEVGEFIDCTSAPYYLPETFNLLGTFEGSVLKVTYEGMTQAGSVEAAFSGTAEFTKSFGNLP